jgi:hypothetical protein
LLLHLGLGCNTCESAAPPCQFAEIAHIRHCYLPDRSYDWIPEEGALVPAKPWPGLSKAVGKRSLGSDHLGQGTGRAVCATVKPLGKRLGLLRYSTEL